MEIYTKEDFLSLAYLSWDQTRVNLNADALTALAKIGRQEKPTPPNWDFYLPESLQAAKNRSQNGSPEFDETVCRAAYFLFVQCALQYCFWEKKKATERPEHWYFGDHKGSVGCAALTTEWYDKGIFPGLHVVGEELTQELWPLLQTMPLAQSRLAILHELADYDAFKLFVYKQIMHAQRVDTTVAAHMARLFPHAFADPFLKKALLYLGILASNMKARGVHLKAELAPFADYRMPQVLRHYGVLDYAPALARKVDAYQQITSGSADEMAIRAGMIAACVKLAEETGMSDLQVDAWLFLQTRASDFQENAKPFHLTTTTHY